MSKKILAVDDDPLILMGLEIVLTEAGYTVECCSKGEETKKLVSEFKPDLIILDIMLADLDGRIIAKDLKVSSESKNIPIVMISANQNFGKDIFSYGIDAFVPKPFDSSHIINIVEETIKK